MICDDARARTKTALALAEAMLWLWRSREKGARLTGAGQQELFSAERLTAGGVDQDLRELARRGEAGEVDDFVVPRASAQPLGVVARGPFDEHLDGAPDESLRAAARVALDALEQTFHARDLDGVRHDPVGDLGGLGAAARGEDEREGGVVADLLDDL